MADVAIRIKSDFEQAEKDFKNLKNLSETAREKIQKFSESFKTEQIQKFTDRNKLAGIAMTATKGKFVGLQTQAKGLEREIQRLIKRGLDPQDDAIRSLTADYDKLQKEIEQTNQSTNKQSSTFMNMTKAILSADVIRGTFRALKNGIIGFVDEARKVEDVQAAFTPLIGGAKKAEELVKELQKTAATTPFTFDAIGKSAKQLLPVMNQDIEQTIATFRMLGDTAGGNAQKLDSITRGFTKAMLKGKVDMESLNMIAEAGVPIFTEMAQSMGYGKDQMGLFFKAVSAGKVSTDDLVNTFKTMTTEGGVFFEGMVIASKTTSGVLSTLADNFSLAASSLGKNLLPYIKQAALWIIDMTAGFIKWINTGNNFKNTVQIIGTVLASAAGAFVAYEIATLAATFTTLGFTTAIKGLTTAIAANPIGAVAALITAVLIPAIIYLVKNWEELKFKVMDFGLSANIAMTELVVTIRQKVMGAFSDLLKELSKLPGVGDKISQVTEKYKRETSIIQASISVRKAMRDQNNKNFEEYKKNKDKEIELAQNAARASVESNKKIIESGKEKEKTFKQMLETMKMTEQGVYMTRIEEAQKFFEQRAALEGIDSESKLEFLRQQEEEIKKIKFKTIDEELQAQFGLTRAIAAEQKKRVQNHMQFASFIAGNLNSMMSDINTVMQNAGVQSRKFAIAMKAVAIAEATINTAIAFTKALATFPPPFGQIAAGVVAAAGAAKVAAIASTPIPKAETGLSNYTVPDVRSNRYDNAPVRASAGETVSVAPRGENLSRDMNVSIEINEETIINVVQKMVDTGQVIINDRNIGTTAFAV